MKKWEVAYKGHEIRVENSICQERLFVDGELQDESSGLAFRSRLYGKIREGNAVGLPILISLGGSWKVHCRIFIDNHLIFHSKPDKEALEAIKRTNELIN